MTEVEICKEATDTHLTKISSCLDIPMIHIMLFVSLFRLGYKMLLIFLLPHSGQRITLSDGVLWSYFYVTAQHLNLVESARPTHSRNEVVAVCRLLNVRDCSSFSCAFSQILFRPLVSFLHGPVKHFTQWMAQLTDTKCIDLWISNISQK